MFKERGKELKRIEKWIVISRNIWKMIRNLKEATNLKIVKRKIPNQMKINFWTCGNMVNYKYPRGNNNFREEDLKTDREERQLAIETERIVIKNLEEFTNFELKIRKLIVERERYIMKWRSTLKHPEIQWIL